MSAQHIRPKKLVSLDNATTGGPGGAALLSAGRRGGSNSPDGPGRREVLRAACASSLGLLCASLTGCGAAPGEGESTPLVSLPAPVGGRITLSLADFPQLREVGGGLVGHADGMSAPIAITHQEEGKFLAFTAMCSHMATTLKYNQLNATLDCGRHGSTFELDGTVITGPATAPLTFIPTELHGGRLGIITG
jgi:nitrite reductase/ring-hydroxylating ferredoxin subunit